ncbi:MAG: PorT family protein [Cytophagales bacterium]|nr:PorT family protein [Cytophagales bacterium]
MTLSSALALAQNPERTVTVNYENQKLSVVLNKMERDLELKFSFVPGSIPLDSSITLKQTNESLTAVLNSLSEQTGIEYKVVKNHIALINATSLIKIKDEIQSHGNQELPVKTIESLPKEMKPKSIDIIAVVEKDARLASISPINEMKPVRPEQTQDTLEHNYFALGVGNLKKYNRMKNPIPGIPEISCDPDKRESGIRKGSIRERSICLGPTVSADFYHLIGNTVENKGFTYKTGINYSIGLSGGFKSGTRWKILMDILYSTKNFDLYYNFRPVDSGDPNIPDRTAYQQAYVEIPLSFNYSILRKGNLIFFWKLGLSSGFLLNKKYQTFRGDDSEIETPESITMKIRPELLGLHVGIETEYQLSDYFSLSLSSDWRQYFKSINAKGPKTRLGLFQFAAGIQYVL